MSKVEPSRRAKTGGRQKGTPNKTTKAIKEMVIEALDKAGGVDYLLTQAEENPNAFLTLVGKTLPLQVAGDPNHPLIHEIRRTIVRP